MAEPRKLVARAAVGRELEKHFSVMCQAFGLDETLARPIYYQDPFFDPQLKRVLVDDGKIVSVLTLIPAKMRLCNGAVVALAGIAGVGTVPSLRNRGYASELIRQTIKSLPLDLGFPLAALATDQPEYYRRFGFATSSTAVSWSAPPASLPAHPAAASVTVLTAAQAAAMSYAIHNVHSQARGEVPGAFLRDVRRWQAVEMLTMGRTLAIWQGERGIEAYVAFHVDTRDQKPVIEVHEIVSVSDIGRKAIVGFLAAQEFAQRIAGETNQSSFLELGLDQVPGISVARLPGVMLRIADLEAVLAAIAETGALTGALSQSRSGLTIRVDAGDGPHFEHPVRMFAIQKEAGPTCVAMGPADEIDGDWLGGEIGALTQMVCGHASASALHSAGRLRASSYEAVRLAEALFPLTDPYLPLPDLF